MCDLYFNEKIPFNEVVHLFKVYEENREIPDATGVDFNRSNYNTLSSFIYKISGEDLLRWKMPNIVYEDNENGITISLIRNYEEAKSVLCFNTWCVFNSKDYWITHKQDGDTIYLIKLINDNCSSFYSVRVEKNGQRHYYAYNHTELSNKNENGYPTIDEFEPAVNKWHRGTVPNGSLQGADEEEEEAQEDQEEVDDLALEVFLVEEQGAAQE